MILRRFLFAGLLSLVSIFNAPTITTHGLRAQLGTNGLPVGFFFDASLVAPPPCSSTVTVACVTGFNLLTFSSSNTLVATLAVPLPATVSTTGLTTSIPSGTYTPPAATTLTAVYSVQTQVLYKDPAGNTLAGAASAGSYSFPVQGTFVPPPAPSVPRVTP